MDIFISNLLSESTFDFGKKSNCKLRKYVYLRNFQFDHFPKLTIYSERRFEMKISMFLLYIFLKSFGQYEMDGRPSVTETDRGGVHEMDRPTNRQKKGNATEINQIL